MMPIKTRDPRKLEAAMQHLQAARDLLKAEDCPKTLNRTRLAISSVKGAIRNAWNIQCRNGGYGQLTAAAAAATAGLCRDCGAVLTSITSGEDGQPNYCETCDREASTP